jgi:hypothetical protein
MFPWEIDSTRFKNFFEGPYLFSAIYRVYKGAYFGQGFQLCGHVLDKEDNFQTLFDKLPLDIKGIILNKVWNEGRELGVVLVAKGEILLPLPLQFLFSQYGRLKEITQPIISVGCGAWNGTLITYRKRSKQYVFEYGTLNVKNKVIIPNFLNKELYKSPTEVYGFLFA